jgi:putative ABC transport system permease protein
VAAVSLLVGGIGIMNIMLVSVTERTREIGIRLAIGALEHEVLLQFLIEAVVLSALGGLVGIVLAFFACLGLSTLMSMPFLFNPSINLVAFGFSAAIGVIFGYMPARPAPARLDPIDAHGAQSQQRFHFLHHTAPIQRFCGSPGAAAHVAEVFRVFFVAARRPSR